MTSGTAPSLLKGHGIKGRLILLLLLVLVPVLIIEAYIYADRFREQRDQEHQANLEIARAVSRAFMAFVQDVLHQEHAIGLAITSSQPMDSDAISRLLGTYSDYEALEDFSWVNSQGSVLHSKNHTLIGTRISEWPLFREIAFGREWVVDPLRPTEAGKKPSFCIARAIRDDNAGFLGMVVATVNPDKLDSVLSVERGEGGGIGIVDVNGMLVYRYPQLNFTWEQRNLLKSFPEIQQALDGHEFVWVAKGLSTNQPRLVASVPIRATGWVVTAGRTEQIALELASSILIFHAILFIGVTITSFGLALLLVRPVVASIRSLRDHALALGQGEMKYTEPSPSATAEIRELANAFNVMTGKVQRRENALRERERLWNLFIAHSPVALAMFDREMRYLNASRRWYECYNLLQGDLIGLSHYDVFPEIPEYWKQIHRRALAGEVASSDLDRFERMDGSVQWLRWEVRPWRNAAGEIGGIVIFSEDITERKQAEDERSELRLRLQRAEKAESLARMAGAIAHNFNNLLGAVIGNLELALDDLLSDSASRTCVIEALRASQRAAEISRFMLTYVGQSVRRPRPLDLSGAVEEALPLLVESIPHHVHLERSLPFPGPLVLADSFLVKQIVHNLLLNSVEAIGSKEGSIVLSVGMERPKHCVGSRSVPVDWEPKDKNYACLKVSDSGEGMDEATMEKIFDPFFSTRFTGRGLGLPTVLGIMRTCDGGITVESQPGKGSTFRMFFPLPVSPTDEPGKDQAPGAGGDDSKGMILVVDDDPIFRIMAQTILTVHSGYTVILASDGTEAVEIFRTRKNEIALVLLDLVMPGMGGWETLAALRSLQPDIPVIVSSAYDEAQLMGRGDQKDQPQGFLPKPYSAADLKAVLTKVGMKMHQQ